jgi:hypothetical protein
MFLASDISFISLWYLRWLERLERLVRPTLYTLAYEPFLPRYSRICQHRWTAIAGMVGFYNTANAGSLNNWVQGSNQQIAFGRGNAGFIAINNEDGAWTRTFTTSLPSATYCDVITGQRSDSVCTGGE